MAKLPKWAQKHIEQLEKLLDETMSELQSRAEPPANSNVVANPYSDLYRQPLGIDVPVAFYLDDRTHFKVAHTRNGIEVHFGGAAYALAVVPRASNVVEVWPR